MRLQLIRLQSCPPLESSKASFHAVRLCNSNSNSSSLLVCKSGIAGEIGYTGAGLTDSKSFCCARLKRHGSSWPHISWKGAVK